MEILLVNSVQIPYWNFKKANWISFYKTVDDSIRWIQPTPETTVALSNYLWKKYSPGRIRNICSWMKQTLRTYLSTISKTRKWPISWWIHNSFEQRPKKLKVEGTNGKYEFQKTNRQAWNLLRKLHVEKTVMKLF